MLELSLLLLAAWQAPPRVEIRVNANVAQGPWKPLFAYFGYDEPNYTYTPAGKKLIAELAALVPAGSPVKVQIRAHHLLVTGNGEARMKWGSTNAFTRDAAGKPVYDWSIVDRIFDTYKAAGARPFVEIGFMPEALSREPQPYVRNWPNTPEGRGWAQPPADYDAWGELVRQWVLHSVARYGREEVEQWSWELWNEPDIFYWRGTPEEYDKLYDVTAAAVKRALPTARVGGPATTDPANEKAAAYLRQFLEHCARNKTPLDFIAFHAKGAPKFVDGHVRMGLARNLTNVQKGLDIIAEFPQYRGLPVILSEYDPEGCAACSPKDRPELGYRNGSLFASYTAAGMANVIRLAGRYKTDVSMLTWAFEFENQPHFAGFRTLETNGIAKPILNFFRMAGMLRGNRIDVRSAGAFGLDTILSDGVRTAPDIDAIATRGDREVAVLVWNYHDDDAPAAASPVRLMLSGIPAAQVQVQHFRVDDSHSNAFTIWKRMGSPGAPSQEQQSALEAAGQLQLLDSPTSKTVDAGKLELNFEMPRQSVSLISVRW